MSHTHPLGQAAAGDPPPIARIEPMTDDRALSIAMQALKDISQVSEVTVEWIGLDDTGLRQRRVEIIAALNHLHAIRARLRGEHGEVIAHD